MFGKKVKKIVALLCLLSLFDTGVMTVHAKNWFFEFEFEDDVYPDSSDIHKKTDYDQHWYISLDKKNATKKNNLSSSNILGCKMHRTTNDNVDQYHTFSNYVNGYPFDYKNEVSSSDKMYLTGKKDNASTSSSKLKISGRFAP